MRSRLTLSIGTGFGVATMISLLEVTTALGAHPQWRAQLFLSGALAGTMLAVIVTQFDFVKRTLGLSFLAIAAWLSADYGKARFAASFAEDRIAGQMWFYGWHILCIALVAHVVSATYEHLGRG